MSSTVVGKFQHCHTLNRLAVTATMLWEWVSPLMLRVCRRPASLSETLSLLKTAVKIERVERRRLMKEENEYEVCRKEVSRIMFAKRPGCLRWTRDEVAQIRCMGGKQAPEGCGSLEPRRETHHHPSPRNTLKQTLSSQDRS